MDLNKAMAEIADLNKAGGKGTAKLSGKTYTNVSTRVEVFRKHFGLEYGIETEVLFPVKGVLMTAYIKDKEGFIAGTGRSYAESLQKDKSLEKLESVAIGRAMASIGLAGGEYASDNEIESWQGRYEPAPKIHIEHGADDVPPEVWLEAKIERMYDYIEKPKSTVEKFAGACVKSQQDPIYGKLTDEQKDTYEIAVKDAENKLKTKLKEKEPA